MYGFVRSSKAQQATNNEQKDQKLFAIGGTKNMNPARWGQIGSKGVHLRNYHCYFVVRLSNLSPCLLTRCVFHFEKLFVARF